MNHIQCFNPNCLHLNPPEEQLCQNCGSELRLKSRYRGLSVISEGNCYRNFLAVDESKSSQSQCVICQFFSQALGQEKALKASQFFEQEATRLDRLGNHPQIPKIMAYFTQDECQYLIHEFIKGHNLASEIAENGLFDEEKIKDLLSNLLSILEFVHQKKVIHGDIKPENIIRASDGRLVLVDFGIDKLAFSRYSTRTVIETSVYAAPEQKQGQVTTASDLYSLGVTCLHLLTNVNPVQLFDLYTGNWVWRRYLGNNAVSESLGKILDRLVQTDLKQRFTSAEAALKELNKLSILKEPSERTETTRSEVEENPLPANSEKNRLSFADKIKNILLTEITPPTNIIPKAKSKVTVLTTKNADYNKLRDLLAAENWKQADQETWRLLGSIAGINKEGLIDPDTLASSTCEDIATIDKLWVDYSNGHFGFSVQKNIYQNLGGDENYNDKIWQAFGDRVGWRLKGNWLNYFELAFDRRQAPKGHLPVEPLKVILGSDPAALMMQMKRGALLMTIFSRLEECEP